MKQAFYKVAYTLILRKINLFFLLCLFFYLLFSSAILMWSKKTTGEVYDALTFNKNFFNGAMNSFPFVFGLFVLFSVNNEIKKGHHQRLIINDFTRKSLFKLQLIKITFTSLFASLLAALLFYLVQLTTFGKIEFDLISIFYGEICKIFLIVFYSCLLAYTIFLLIRNALISTAVLWLIINLNAVLSILDEKGVTANYFIFSPLSSIKNVQIFNLSFIFYLSYILILLYVSRKKQHTRDYI